MDFALVPEKAALIGKDPSATTRIVTMDFVFELWEVFNVAVRG